VSPLPKRDAYRTRLRLLEAAEEEFAGRGYHGARVKRIVVSAGVNDRMLYHYFGNKEGLYRAVVQRGLRALADEIDEVLARVDEQEPISAIEAVWRRHFEALSRRPRLGRLLMNEALGGWKTFPLQEEPETRLRNKLARILKNAGAQRQLTPGLDPRFVLTFAPFAFMSLELVAPRLRRGVKKPLDKGEGRAWMMEQLLLLLRNGLSRSAKT